MGRQSHVPLVFSHGTVLLKAFHRQSELHWRLRIQKRSCRLVHGVKLVYNVCSYWVHCASSSHSWESSTAFLIEILIGDMSRRGVVAKGCTNMRGSLASGDGASAPLPWGCSRSKGSLDPTGWSRYSLCGQMVWGKKTDKSFSTTPDMASLPCTSQHISGASSGYLLPWVLTHLSWTPVCLYGEKSPQVADQCQQLFNLQFLLLLITSYGWLSVDVVQIHHAKH